MNPALRSLIWMLAERAVKESMRPGDEIADSAMLPQQRPAPPQVSPCEQPSTRGTARISKAPHLSLISTGSAKTARPR